MCVDGWGGGRGCVRVCESRAIKRREDYVFKLIVSQSIMLKSLVFHSHDEKRHARPTNL